MSDDPKWILEGRELSHEETTERRWQDTARAMIASELAEDRDREASGVVVMAEHGLRPATQSEYADLASLIEQAGGILQVTLTPRTIAPVLRASSPGSLRASRSIHKRKLRESCAPCGDPENCLVCSESKILFNVKQAQVARKLRPVDNADERTSDAHATHEGARLRDCEGLGNTSKSSAAALGDLTVADVAQRIAGILTAYNTRSSSRCNQDPEWWEDQLVYHQRGNKHVSVSTYAEAALGMEGKLASGTYSLNPGGEWAMFRRNLRFAQTDEKRAEVIEESFTKPAASGSLYPSLDEGAA